MRNTSLPVEYGRHLPFRPLRISFPQIAHKIGHSVRDIQRPDLLDVIFIHFQELTAGRKIIVDDIKNFSVDTFSYACQNDRFGAVIHIGQRHRISTAQLKINSESVNPNCP